MRDRKITGRCLCGAVRYEVAGPPLRTSYCYCEDCRRASGAPAVLWTFFPARSITFVHGAPRLLQHAGRERTFCGQCGTPITFFDPSFPNEIEVTTCSLEMPEAFVPDDHTWVVDRLPWFQLNDDRPHYDQWGPPIDSAGSPA